MLRAYRDRFMKAKRLRWRPKTTESYRVALGSYITHVGPDHWPPTVESILGWLEAVRGRASETTAASYYSHLRAFLNFLEQDGVTFDNPIRAIKRLDLAPRPPKPQRPSAFTRQELDALFTHLSGRLPAFDAQRDLTLLHFQYVTGMRSGEVLALSWSQVDLDGHAAQIRAESAKGNKGRTVYFNRAAQDRLADWRARLDDFEYQRPWVFPALFYDHYRDRFHPGYRPLSVSGLHQMLQRRLEGAGLPRRRVHDLRHAHALHALQAGIPINQVQKQLGHSSIQVTQAYLNGYDEDRAASYRNFLEGN